MLKPKSSPKESRSNNFKEKEEKEGSKGIQQNLVAKVAIFYLILYFNF